jgi:hypothetical protein
MKLPIQLGAITLFCALLSGTVAAQTAEDYHPFLTDKFNIHLGIFWPDKEYTVQVDGSAPDEEIDFDEQFGINDFEATASLNFRWRFGEKWSLWGQYWSTSETAKGVLEEDVEWEDYIFKKGTSAKLGFGMDIARVFFGRTFNTGPRHEFGAGLGFHWMELDTFIEGEVILDEDTTGFQRASVDAEIPLPNIGFWYMYSWSPKWIFQTRLDWLSASIGDYSGGLWNAQAGVHWQAFENLGVGLYYNNFKLDVDVDKSDWHGAVEATQQGPYLALTATW